ncbi:hypothetical protein [Rhizobium leguminosarum]|uniref:hypothetical protein n=2 Tax=Rhizobium leguminosarum TaxID=384 RepID=UPI00036B78AC|nr:hypothetical protein [Rhizobium leguminosarum]
MTEWKEYYEQLVYSRWRLSRRSPSPAPHLVVRAPVGPMAGVVICILIVVFLFRHVTEADPRLYAENAALTAGDATKGKLVFLAADCASCQMRAKS